LRILINALAIVGGGGVSHLKGILPALGEVDPDNTYLVLRTPWQPFWDFDLPANVRLVTAPLANQRNVPQRALWEQFALPSFIRQQAVDVLFCPTDIASLLAPCPEVLAIRNPNPYLGGGMDRGLVYSINRKILLRNLTGLSARKSRTVIFVSDFSRSVVCSVLRIPRQKTAVVHHGLHPMFHERPGPKIEPAEVMGQPYLLSVSSIAAHKNYPFLAQVFARLARDPNFKHHLILAGPPVFQQDVERIKEITREANVADRVHLLGQVPYEDLPALYRGADLFVFPSLLETFGHPLIEAMASGLPVVASNRTSIPELCGDAALYFDPEECQDAIDQITRLLADHALRQELVEKGLTRSRDFTWQNAARQTAAILQAATTNPIPHPRKSEE
jgi:glycosyltransferase involved in cell wall biosynthesis